MLVVCVNDNWGNAAYHHPRFPQDGGPKKGIIYRVVRERAGRRKPWLIFYLLKEYPGGHGWQKKHFRPVNPDALDVFKQEKELIDA